MSEPENKSEMTDAPVSDAASTESTSSPEASRRKQASARRRAVVWGLIVVLVGAAVGATVGWSSQEPIYTSEGLIYIEPSMPSPQDPGGRDILPMFDGYVAAQVQLLSSRRTSALALKTEVWKQVEPGATEMDVAAFEARREIVYERGTQHIRLQFRDAQPEVAQAGARAIVEAYTKLSAELNDADQRLEYARSQVERLHAQVRSTTAPILALTADYGGVEGMEVLHPAAIEQVLATEKELRAIQAEIRRRQAAQAPRDAPGKGAEEIALESSQMAEYLLGLAGLEAEAQLLAAKVAADSPHLEAVRMRIRVLKERIEKFADAWNRAHARHGDDPTLDELQAAEKELRARLDALRTQSRRIGEIRVEVDRLRAERDDFSQQLKQMEALRDQLRDQLLGSGRIKVFDPGSLPKEPYRDDRTLYAWIGGLVGGLGALFLVLLFAFAARRLGHAADANAYHAKVRAAVELLPKRIGEWRAHDVGMPPGAAKLPRPNVAMGREFQNPSTGEHATLRIVQCKDARDLAAYYPPIQYPAEGWTLREAEPRHLPALLAAIPGTVYRFTKDSADGSSEVLVYNFFARPDGSIESGPAGALNETAQTHTQALGAAQFQILLGPTMTRDRRDEVFRTLIAAALPVMDALCVEDEA